MSTRSTASRPRSRSSRRPRRRTRAPPSAPSPRSTTTCACCGRASACPIRRPQGCRSKARSSRRWSTACWRCRKAQGSICWRRSCAAAQTEAKKKAEKNQHNHGPAHILSPKKFAVTLSRFTIPQIEPCLFSYKNPYGDRPACGGLGVKQHIDEDLVIPDKETTLRKGAIAPWAKSSSPYYIQTLTALGKFYKFTLDTKWKDLPKKTQAALLHRSEDDEIKFSYEDGVRSYDTKKPFEGVITNLERRYRETESEWAREELAKYFSDIPCAGCNGHRLKPEALCVKIGGKHIGEISELSVLRAGEWFETVPKALTAQQNEIAARVLKEIRERLSFLLDVGLNYLTLARASGTLSGGESQRIRLASQIGSGLTGGLYVLDEPSIGLHQRDNARLFETLERLRDLGI